MSCCDVSDSLEVLGWTIENACHGASWGEIVLAGGVSVLPCLAEHSVLVLLVVLTRR
jgi:hypothetical protein